jgi:ribonuclease D
VQIQNGDHSNAKNLKELLTDKSVLKIFHYARFDVAVLNYAFGVEVEPIYCTKIASKLSRTYTDRHGLKNLCKEILGIEISKGEQTSDWGRENLSDEQLKYAAGDVLHLHNLKIKLDAMLERENKTALARECFNTVATIAKLELNEISPEELFSH